MADDSKEGERLEEARLSLAAGAHVRVQVSAGVYKQGMIALVNDVRRCK